jgi:peptidoglycan/xylan/chitin deacetylase (PgdA/CDA1 family)
MMLALNTFLHKQLLMVILIAAAALGIVAGTWGVALYDSNHAYDDPLTTPYASLQATTSSTQTTLPTTPQTTTHMTMAATTTQSPGPIQPTGKYIALTFDDGPSASYTSQILDILEKYNAKATFFVNGYQLGTSKAALLQRMVAMGCEIGNHTQDHKRMTELSAQELYEQIITVNDMVRRLCGYNITLLRPPGGHTSLAVMQAMYDAGLRMSTIMWNNDSLDWSFHADYANGKITREEAVKKTYDMIMGYPLDSAIVLMHDIKGITPDVLELVLKKLSAEGYTFVTISEMFDIESMGEDAYFSKFYSANQIVTLK